MTGLDEGPGGVEECDVPDYRGMQVLDKVQRERHPQVERRQPFPVYGTTDGHVRGSGVTGHRNPASILPARVSGVVVTLNLFPSFHVHDRQPLVTGGGDDAASIARELDAVYVPDGSTGRQLVPDQQFVAVCSSGGVEVDLFCTTMQRQVVTLEQEKKKKEGEEGEWLVVVK